MARMAPVFRIPSLSVGIGIILAATVVGLTAAYLIVPLAYQGAVIFFGAGVATAAAIATAFYTARTLQIAHVKHEREPQEVSARFAERWNDASMFHVRKACHEIIEMRNDERDKVKEKIEADGTARSNIVHILNFLEELAVAVRTERADYTYSKRMFAGIVINVYHVAQHWIDEERKRRGRPQLWVELRWLYEQWSG
jgi:hypothetical protein